MTSSDQRQPRARACATCCRTRWTASAPSRTPSPRPAAPGAIARSARPLIEPLHLFTSAGTLSPQTLDRVYSFLDWDGWSGERVVLRPDSTIPAARLYAEHLRRRPTSRSCSTARTSFASPTTAPTARSGSAASS